jgi:GT2 family glycosyltransferase
MNTSPKSLALTTTTSDRQHYASHIDQVLTHKAEGPFDLVDTKWLPGFFFLLTRQAIENVGVFDDETFTIWFGDDDYQKRLINYANGRPYTAITKIQGIFVYHFGGQSYKYGRKDVGDIIKKDRLAFHKRRMSR